MNTVTTTVWDPLLRAAHWGLVGAFSLAYVSAEALPSVHLYAGCSVLALVAFRAVWGVIGPSPARFVGFLRPWPAVRRHLVSLAGLAPGRYLGHTPAGGWMVVFLLFALLATTLSGVALQQEVMISASAIGVEWEEFEFLEELHEFFANLTLLLVGFHLVGVVIESLLIRENLPKAMVTGRKRSG